MEQEIIQQQARCIAHEIRNHLSICELYSEIIKKKLNTDNYTNPSVDNAISNIKKAIKLMNNSLLDLKTLNNIKQTEIDLGDIIKEAIELSKVYINDKKIDIIDNINTTAIVYIDENKFLACLINIIKNAIEAIPNKGWININLIINQEKATIKIINNGTQISKSKQKEIFSEGFTTKKTGSGLGLYICQRDLASQNCELKLTKSTSKETEFDIILPIVK